MLSTCMFVSLLRGVDVRVLAKRPELFFLRDAVA